MVRTLLGISIVTVSLYAAFMQLKRFHEGPPWPIPPSVVPLHEKAASHGLVVRHDKYYWEILLPVEALDPVIGRLPGILEPYDVDMKPEDVLAVRMHSYATPTVYGTSRTLFLVFIGTDEDTIQYEIGMIDDSPYFFSAQNVKPMNYAQTLPFLDAVDHAFTPDAVHRMRERLQSVGISPEDCASMWNVP